MQYKFNLASLLLTGTLSISVVTPIFASNLSASVVPSEGYYSSTSTSSHSEDIATIFRTMQSFSLDNAQAFDASMSPLQLSFNSANISTVITENFEDLGIRFYDAEMNEVSNDTIKSITIIRELVNDIENRTTYRIEVLESVYKGDEYWISVPNPTGSGPSLFLQFQYAGMKDGYYLYVAYVDL